MPEGAEGTEVRSEADRATRRIVIGSSRIWPVRRTIGTLLEAEPVRPCSAWCGGVEAVAGWGREPPAWWARSIASVRGLPTIAIEDGFLRSIRPGPREPAIGWVVDSSGIHYDAGRASDLEGAVVARARAADRAERERVGAALTEIRRLRLSKFNHAPLRTAAEMGLSAGRDIVLVVDQTVGAASIRGAMVDERAFGRMLEAAIAENPGRTVVVKAHPETISGNARGHLVEAGRRSGVTVLTEDTNPWSLIEISTRVYTVSSQIGMEAMLAGVPVTCFGAASHAGWGLTDDRFPAIPGRRQPVDALDFAAAAYLDYTHWIDPWSCRKVEFETAIDILDFLGDRHRRGKRTVCVGFNRWKRDATRRFLDGAGGPPRFVLREAAARAVAAETGARLVVWGSRQLEGGEPAADTPPVTRMEDGFLRSVGLGASHVAPVSLVLDDVGIYFDPARPSGFERIAETTVFDAKLIERAARLRREVVARGLSKYNDAAVRTLDLPTGVRRILVPGQVADDASVRLGSLVVRDNLSLLERVRQRNPDAYVIFKPHPDVQRGYRAGAIPEAVALRHADRIVEDVAISSLLATVEAVETMTSLTGFEALLRGVPVTTHGAPFYSGWGLTEDLVPVPRRTRRLTLDELVAATLILYPDYVDPVSGLPCPVEVIVQRLSEAVSRETLWQSRLARKVRHGIAWTSHNIRAPILRRFKR